MEQKKIKNFRINLWKTILGLKFNENLCNTPETNECLNLINTITAKTWEQYTSINFSKMDCFMMKFPIVINNDNISYKCRIPDFNISFEGISYLYLPNIFTV